MAIIVQKFGGTSVANLERIRHVADIVVATRKLGHDVVVVLSAMHGDTDRLIQLARSVNGEPNAREYDMLVSTGEQISVSLLSMTLLSMGCPSRSFNAAQVGIQTTSDHKKARIMGIDDKVIRAEIFDGRVPVITGFQGIDQYGNITTLGRGGSDTTAVALAAALGADECQIYTDVDGVYTTDPRVVADSRRLERVTFEEMLELASLGAKVLQIRAVEFAGKYNVPLRVLSSFEPGPGTLIAYEDIRVEQPLVSGIAFDRNQAKLTILGVPDKPGVAKAVLGAVSDKNIDVDMIIQNIPRPDETIDLSFTVQRDDFKSAYTITQQVAQQLGAREVVGDDKIAKLSIVGVGMKSHAGVATTMFDALGEEGINIQLISTSEIKISVVIHEKYLELGARTLHSAFGLDQAPKEEGSAAASTDSDQS